MQGLRNQGIADSFCEWKFPIAEPCGFLFLHLKKSLYGPHNLMRNSLFPIPYSLFFHAFQLEPAEGSEP
jgi:hypothetical protein